MADSDRTIVTHLDEGRFGSAGLATAVTTTTGAVQQLHQRTNMTFLTADSGAAGTDYASPLMYTDRALLIVGVVILPTTAVTASTSVYKTLLIGFNDGAGGTTSNFFTAATNTAAGATNGTGSWTAAQVLAYTWTSLGGVNAAGTGAWLATCSTNASSISPFPTVANLNVPANKCIQFTTTHASTGTILGPFGIQLLYQEV